jgi:hypothetical protein
VKPKRSRRAGPILHAKREANADAFFVCAHWFLHDRGNCNAMERDARAVAESLTCQA